MSIVDVYKQGDWYTVLSNWFNDPRYTINSIIKKGKTHCIGVVAIEKEAFGSLSTMAANFTYLTNVHLENLVSSKTVRRELHKAGFHERAAIRKICLVFPLFCPLQYMYRNIERGNEVRVCVCVCVCVCVWNIL